MRLIEDSLIGQQNEDFPDGMGINIASDEPVGIRSIEYSLRLQLEGFLEKHGIVRLLNGKNDFHGRSPGRELFLPHHDDLNGLHIGVEGAAQLNDRAVREADPSNPRDYDLLFFPGTPTGKWLHEMSVKWGVQEKLDKVGLGSGDAFLNRFATFARDLPGNPAHPAFQDYQKFISEMGQQIVASNFSTYPHSILLLRERFVGANPRKILHGNCMLTPNSSHTGQIRLTTF